MFLFDECNVLLSIFNSAEREIEVSRLRASCSRGCLKFAMKCAENRQIERVWKNSERNG